jgi:hypothetical protein
MTWADHAGDVGLVSRAEIEPPQPFVNASLGSAAVVQKGVGCLGLRQTTSSAGSVPAETAPAGDSGESGSNTGGRAAEDDRHWRNAMRLVDVVLASALLGLGLGLLQTGFPGARANDTAAADCATAKCERIAWLRTPAMRRTSYSE